MVSEQMQEEPAVEQRNDARQQQLVQIMTTEHFTLQTLRSATIADASGRAALFLTSLSSALVALALIGQFSHGGTAFFAVALVLLPTLLFLGLVTFQRVLQSAIEDMVCARGINRIRHFYTEVAPQLGAYFILSTHDDGAGMSHDMRPSALRWQSFLTTGGMVAVVNGVIVGVWATLLLLFLTPIPVPLTVGAGVLTFILGVAVQQTHQLKVWRALDHGTPVLFPSPHPANRTKGAVASDKSKYQTLGL